MHRTFRHSSLLVALAALALSSPARLGAQEPARTNAFTQPHVLRYATSEDISTLNPVLNQQGALGYLSQLTMAYLVRYDHDNRPVPELATEVPSQRNGGISADGKTIVFHLRKGVKWSDGAPFEADDVKFSIEAVLNSANIITSREGFDLIEKVDVPDKYTVALHLKRPFSPFLPTFFGSGGANPCILPKHLLGALPDINHASYNDLPVGIGPFRYTAWKRGQAVEMEANPFYWRGLPKLKRVVFDIVPDRNTVFTQLRTGELDMWFGVSGVYYKRAAAELHADVTVLYPSFDYNHIDFNVTRPALKERAVRQALRLALDRATLREKVALGLGTLQESIVPPAYPGAPHVPMVPFDIGKANALLERAGWKRGPDGVRAKGGVRLSLEVATSAGTPDNDTMLELIRGWWQQIGVEFTIKRALASLMFAPADQGGVVLGGRFDVVFFRWTVSNPDDLKNLFACSAIPPGGQNVMHYCNPALDALLDGFLTHYDEAAQNADLEKEVRIITDDVPTIVTSVPDNRYISNRDLRGFKPNAVSPFDDFMNVDI